MDRGLREFRVRGVKDQYSVPENVVKHPVFQSGRTTTRFIEETPGYLYSQNAAIAQPSS